MPDPRKVFVVFGRNLAAKDAVFHLLRTIDLRPLEWEEVVRATRSSSPYIYDVLEQGFELAQAILIILTPDEIVELHPQLRSNAGDDAPRNQPRANVLFEAGMAFMRDRNRTILLEFGSLSQASDLHGIHTIRASPESGAELRNQIAERLKIAGCAVVTDGEDWLRAGNFSSAFLATGTKKQNIETPTKPREISTKIERTSDIEILVTSDEPGHVETANFMALAIENTSDILLSNITSRVSIRGGMHSGIPDRIFKQLKNVWFDWEGNIHEGVIPTFRPGDVIKMPIVGIDLLSLSEEDKLRFCLLNGSKDLQTLIAPKMSIQLEYVINSDNGIILRRTLTPRKLHNRTVEFEFDDKIEYLNF